MPGIGCQNLPIQRFRLGKAPGLVQPEGVGKRTGNLSRLARQSLPTPFEMPNAPPGQIPVIRSSQSTLQQLVQSAPQLMAKLNNAADKLNDILNTKNQKAFGDILTNLDTTTTMLAKRSADIDATLANFSQASKALAQASTKIGPTLSDAVLAAA